MPSVTPKYRGTSGESLIGESEETLIRKGKMLKPYSADLRKGLREYYPDKAAVEDPAWGHPADIFVNEVLNASNWAASMIFNMQEDISAQELRVEYTDLLKALKTTEKKLRAISPDLDRLISADAEPQPLADQIQQMVDYLKAAKPLVDKMPRAKRPEQKKGPIAVDMTEKILSVIKGYDIQLTGEWMPGVRGKKMQIIKILKMVGDEIGLKLKQEAWRKLVQKVMEQS